LEGTLFIYEKEMEAFVMPPSFRQPQQPDNIQVVRFSVFTDPANHQCNLAVRALSPWMGLPFSYGNEERIMAREKSKFGKVSVKK
jgi:hypothetical protein